MDEDFKRIFAASRFIMKNLLLLFALLLATFSGLSQGTVRGVVTSLEDGNAIPFAKISIVGTEKFEGTDFDGKSLNFNNIALLEARGEGRDMGRRFFVCSLAACLCICRRLFFVHWSQAFSLWNGRRPLFMFIGRRLFFVL